MPTLIEFAFESRLTDVDPTGIVQLARQVWRHNTERALTGEMRVSELDVRQVVEGEHDIVLPLVARILSDGRHGNIRVVALGPIGARRFGGWQVHGLPMLESRSACSADTGLILRLADRLETKSVTPLRRRA